MTVLTRASACWCVTVVAVAWGARADEPFAAPSPAPTAAATAAPPATPATPSAELLFKNGFRLRTPDGANELRLQLSGQLDSRIFFGDSVAPDSFDIRRARIDVQGKMNGFLTLRIQAAMEGAPYIRNCWVDLRQSDAFHLRLGQMKVPFSTSWMTRDNQVNFVERGTSTPVYPFFDRGAMVWGDVADQRLSYQLGAFTGAGVDVDYGNGDIDDHKDVALRLFAQPFRSSANQRLQGLYLALNGTYGATSVPTTRYETRGLSAANYESQVWRWRTEQLLGGDGRAVDQITATIDSRSRWGAEAHWLSGAFSASVEWLVVRYDNVAIFHDYWVGSNRLLHEPVLARNGAVESLSGWLSLFLTGERKTIDAFGWQQPEPVEPWAPGEGGSGAWELLGRFSLTTTDVALFDSLRVNGFGAGDLAGTEHMPVAAGSSVSAAVLQGASKVYEGTLGVNWTANRNLRFQLGLSSIWAPAFAASRDGIVSGGSSNLANCVAKNRLVEREISLILRCSFRI